MKTAVGLTSTLTEDQLFKLDSFGLLYNQMMHRLYVDMYVKKLDVNALASSYQSTYSISKRHFNSLRLFLQGKVSSILALTDNYIVDTEYRLESITQELKWQRKTYKELQDKIKVGKMLTVKETEKKEKLHSKIKYNQIRLDRNKSKLAKLLQTKKTGFVKLCFGSRDLFRQQFQVGRRNNLTPFKTHEQWKDEWHYQRRKSFEMVGSKDETAGNQTAQISHMKDNIFKLKLNVNHNADASHKYVEIEFTLTHEADTLKRIIMNNQGKDKTLWQALTYRLTKLNNRHLSQHKQNKYEVAVSFEKHLIKKTYTAKDKGCIGLDINQDHLAVADIDAQGNLINIATFAYDLSGTSKENTESIALAVKKLMAFSWEKNKPIVMEDLDFKEKKRTLTSGVNKRRNKQLSSFAYAKVIEIVKARAEDNFIEVRQVNPAYTSVIGYIKYSKRNRISVHHAAALCIGRKGLNYQEKQISLKNKHVDSSLLPVRNEKKKNSYWRELKNNMLKPLQHEKVLRLKRKKLRCHRQKESPQLSALSEMTINVDASTLDYRILKSG